jgi:hypothetical protein
MRILSVLSLAAAAAAAAAAQFAIHIVPSPALPNPAVLPPSTHATLSTLARPAAAAAAAAAAAPPPHSDDSTTAYATARLSPANTLAFANISAGSYLVDVHCATHVFAPLRIDVDAHGAVEGAWDTFRGNEWDNRGESRLRAGGARAAAGEEGGVVVDVRALGARNFFMERTKCE